VEGRGSTQPGPTFSLVYAMPLLQHQAQFGLNPAMTTAWFGGSDRDPPPVCVDRQIFLYKYLRRLDTASDVWAVQ